MFWSNDSNRCMHARYMCRTDMWMSKSWTGKLHYLIMYVSVARTARKARHTHVTRTSHARTAGAYAAGAFALCTSRSGVCGRSGVRGVPKGVQQASISWSGVFRMRCYIQCAARIPLRLGGAWSRGTVNVCYAHTLLRVHRSLFQRTEPVERCSGWNFR